jgi:hypothetical protein
LIVKLGEISKKVWIWECGAGDEISLLVCEGVRGGNFFLVDQVVVGLLSLANEVGELSFVPYELVGVRSSSSCSAEVGRVGNVGGLTE